jgi:hypothetical protein
VLSERQLREFGDAALRGSPAIRLAEALVTPLTLDHGLDHIQVALNIPPFSHRPGAPHIDGHRPEATSGHAALLPVPPRYADPVQVLARHLHLSLHRIRPGPGRARHARVNPTGLTASGVSGWQANRLSGPDQLRGAPG